MPAPCRPARPRATPELHALPSGDWETSGDFQLRLWFRWALRRLTWQEASEVTHFRQAHPNRSVGSFCAGTDSPILVQQAYDLEAEHAFGPQVHTDAAFSAEINVGKQRFLADLHEGSLQCLFRDALEVGADKPTAHDVLSNAQKPIPSVSDVVGGFPCQDASTLNHAQARSTIQDASLRTGSVFHAILGYARHHGQHLQSMLLENVTGLLRLVPGPDPSSNYEWAMYLFEQAGFWAITFDLMPQMFGFPVSRQRLWFIVLPMETLRQANLGPQDAAALAQNLMERLVAGDDYRRPLDDFLLPESSPLIQRMIEEAVAKYDAKQAQDYADALAANTVSGIVVRKARRTRDMQWPRKHAEEFDKKNLDWWQVCVPSDEQFRLFPGLKALVPRQFELLRLEGFQFPDTERTCKVSDTLSRARSVPGSSSIVTPSSIIYLGHKCRVMHGRESLALQGIHFGVRQCRLDRWTSGTLMDLGGNAFHGLCCAASMVVREALLAHCCWRASASRAALVPAPQVVLGGSEAEPDDGSEFELSFAGDAARP